MQPPESPPLGYGGYQRVLLSQATFFRLARWVLELSGIHLARNKRVLLESRLQERLQALHLKTFEAYARALEHGPEARKERVRLVEAITTHKTDFFREPGHFELLEAHLRAEARDGKTRVRTWSAACSSGPEPYSMAMVAQDLVEEGAILEQAVLATDISARILGEAQQAIYYEPQLSPVSQVRRRRYFLRSKDPRRRLVKVGPELRSKVSFRSINLTQAGTLDVPRGFSAIFCRNVLIYFEPEVQRSVAGRLLEHLKPGGLLFLGHAESSAMTHLEADAVAPTVYRASGRRP